MSDDVPHDQMPSVDLRPRFPAFDVAHLHEITETWRDLVTFHVAAVVSAGVTDPAATLGLATWLDAVHEDGSPEERWSLTLAATRAGHLSLTHAAAHGFNAHLAETVERMHALDPTSLVHQGMLHGMLLLHATCRYDAAPEIWSWTAGPDCHTIEWVSLHMTLVAYTAKLISDMARIDDADPLHLMPTILGEPGPG